MTTLRPIYPPQNIDFAETVELAGTGYIDGFCFLTEAPTGGLYATADTTAAAANVGGILQNSVPSAGSTVRLGAMATKGNLVARVRNSTDFAALTEGGNFSLLAGVVIAAGTNLARHRGAPLVILEKIAQGGFFYIRVRL